MTIRFLRAVLVAVPMLVGGATAGFAQPAPTAFNLVFTFVNTNQLPPIVTGTNAAGAEMTTRVNTNVGWLMNLDGNWFGNQMGATCRAVQRFEGTTQVEAMSNCTFVDRGGDMLFERITRLPGETASTGQFTGGTGKYAGVVSEPFRIMGYPALGRTLDGFSVSAGEKHGTYTGGTAP